MGEGRKQKYLNATRSVLVLLLVPKVDGNGTREMIENCAVPSECSSVFYFPGLVCSFLYARATSSLEFLPRDSTGIHERASLCFFCGLDVTGRFGVGDAH